MPMPIVVDASVAIALIRREPVAPSARRTIAQHGAAGQRLLVPDVFWIELVNVLARRYSATSEEIVGALRDIDDLAIESIRLDRALLLAAIDMQQRHRLPAYDAVYLALVEAEDGQLITLDARLADAAGGRAIRIDGMPPRHLAEETATYGGEPIDWARFGPYLARLRAEAREGVRAVARD
ncbi:MAG: type II toxin-antitoxin system VapC family toxin [Chloroflexota bacterium]